MIRSGFFDSIEGDRTYNAEDMTMLYEGIVSDGILKGVGADLKVEPCSPAGMNISVLPGKALIAGRWMRNTEDFIITLEAAGAQPRIDLVVAEVDYLGRKCTINVKKGTPAAEPVAPELEDSSYRKEIQFARIQIDAGATAITKEKIRDEREYSSSNDALNPYGKVKKYIHPHIYTYQNELADFPNSFEERTGQITVIDIDMGNFHETQIEVFSSGEISVPDHGIWVAMLLPNDLNFPEDADLHVELSKSTSGAYGMERYSKD